MLAWVRTPFGATCKGVLQLEATFIDVKKIYLHLDSNPGLWNTRFESRWRYMFFTSIKVSSIWRTSLRVAPKGVLTQASIAKY